MTAAPVRCFLHAQPANRPTCIRGYTTRPSTTRKRSPVKHQVKSKPTSVRVPGSALIFTFPESIPPQSPVPVGCTDGWGLGASDLHRRLMPDHRAGEPALSHRLDKYGFPPIDTYRYVVFVKPTDWSHVATKSLSSSSLAARALQAHKPFLSRPVQGTSTVQPAAPYRSYPERRVSLDYISASVTSSRSKRQGSNRSSYLHKRASYSSG